MKTKTLFIGCGGSGIKTLTRVNEMLAGNPKTRQTVREDISYIVVDTSIKETETFEKNIKKQMGGAGLPIIRKVQITKSFYNLSDIVDPNFTSLEKQAEKDEIALKKLARLKENWWYSPSYDINGNPCKPVPFKAIHITEPIEAGAGQCGPVSFLSAWNYLPKFKLDIENVVEEIQVRNQDVSKEDMRLNVFIVAGTAGGTGRGCWPLIGFKTRQCLERMGFKIEPIGVFFDSTCFKNVGEDKPDNRINISINSLTAMSELSAWMKLPTAGSFMFSLPNLNDPDPKLMDDNNTTDVIHVPQGADNGRSPVTAAYLIFGNNGTRLQDNDQYHEMAAAALYSMVAEDRHITDRTINHHQSIRSFGAITFEVDTIPIRRFLEALVRREYCKKLYKNVKDDDNLEREVDELVGTANSQDEKTFLGLTNFTIDKEVSFESIEPKLTESTLLQRLMYNASQQLGLTDEIYTLPTDDFVGTLQGQEPDEASTKAKNLLSLENFDWKFFEESMKEINLDKISIKKTISDIILKAFGCKETDNMFVNQDEKTLSPSVGRAKAVAEKLRASFKESIKNLMGSPKEGEALKISFDDCSIVDAQDCIKQFTEGPLATASGKKFWEIHVFTDTEIESLKEDFQKYQRVAIFFALREKLVAKFKEAIDIIEAIEVSLQIIEDGLKSTTRTFHSDICKLFDKKGEAYENVFKQLFVDPDTDEYLGLPKADSYLNTYRRVLKPIMSQQEVEKLVSNPEKRGGVTEKPIKDRLIDEAQKLIKGNGYASDEYAKSSIKKAFIKLITDNVTLGMVEGSDFMTANFNFEVVLKGSETRKGNLYYWDELLRTSAGDEDRLGRVTDRLRMFLGCETLSNEEGHLRIDEDTIWQNIITSMVGSCKPWIRLKDTAKPTYLDAITLLPVALSDDEVNEIQNQVKSVHKRSIDLIHARKEGDSLPKDRIVVFSHMGVSIYDENDCPFKYIESLSYWQEAEYKKLLVEAEDKQARAYFHPNTSKHADVKWGENTDTHGFVSPIFLNQEQLSCLRWRPWKPTDEDEVDLEVKRWEETKQAMLFAFLGNGDIARSTLDEVVAEGWKGLPLLKFDRKVTFSRECNSGSAWKKGTELGGSLSSAMRYLFGQGRKDHEDLGNKFTEEQEDGNAIRKSILDEKKSFDLIFEKIGKKRQKEIEEALLKWLKEKAESSRSKDTKKLLKELHDSWESYLKTKR